ncbi:MAG: hypothetical protein WD009_14245 [Phycisphaeraceae bacterium]
MPHPESHRRYSGRRVLLALLAALVLLPFVTWVTLRWVEGQVGDPPPLEWRERDEWRALPVRWTAVAEDGRVPGAGAGSWRDLDRTVERDAAAALTRAAALAARGLEPGDWRPVTAPPGRTFTLPSWAQPQADAGEPPFRSPATRDELDALAEQSVGRFYVDYLLGTWHRLQTTPATPAPPAASAPADAAYSRAFADAEAVIRLRYVDEAGAPVAGLPVGSLALTVEPSVLLVYPALVTDDRGRVHLPVPAGVYRVVAAPQPRGGRTVRYNLHHWFDFPGRVGALPTAIVESAD